MREAPEPPPRRLAFLALAAFVIVGGSGAFAYTAGWLSPERLTSRRLVDSLAPANGPALGYRRNHAKGICFTGVFQSNGNGVELSRAQVFARGESPALGRFNLGTPDPQAPDATVRVRGLGLQVSAPGGQVWRSAMIDLPFFPVSTPQAFYALQTAAHSPDPGAMRSFAAAHPEFARFGAWAGSAPWTASYAEEAYNSLNSFIFIDRAGTERAVRWSLLPEAEVNHVTRDALTALGPDHLAQEITQRVAAASPRWRLVITVADPGDQTADPTQPWPSGRRSVEVGTLVVQRIEPERDGPCRDINFDPTVLPDGMRVSDDPFPAARSAAYARSYDLRSAEARHYPYRQQAGTEASR